MMPTSNESIALMRQFAQRLKEYDIVFDAVVDDWNQFNGFAIIVESEFYNRYTTNKIKAIVNTVLREPRFDSVVLEGYEKRHGGSIGFWSFDFRVNL